MQVNTYVRGDAARFTAWHFPEVLRASSPTRFVLNLEGPYGALTIEFSRDKVLELRALLERELAADDAGEASLDEELQRG